jgi:hypothetical protein
MNRGRLFAQIEHVERIHSTALERPKRPPPASVERPSVPTPRERAEQLFRPVLTASPAAARDRGEACAPNQAADRRVAAGARCQRRREAQRQGVEGRRDARSGGVRTDRAAAGRGAPPFVIDVGDRKVSAQISAKSLKKALALIAEHGADKLAVILQGKLEEGDVIAEAGLVAQVKGPKSPA